MTDRDTARHLFLFWRWPSDGIENILHKIGEGFKINQVAYLHWTKERIIENFQRFYAMAPGDAYKKFEETGATPFLFVIAEDPSPIYQYRVAGGSGYKFVNVRSFDLKQILHKQQGTSLYATNTPREFRRDLMYLTGQRAADYQPPKGDWDGEIEEMHRDIIGADGWRDLSEMFSVLNEAVDYVVLNNFDALPDDRLHENIDIDIDILVEDVDARNRAASILKKDRGPNSVKTDRGTNPYTGHADPEVYDWAQKVDVMVGGKKVWFDFRSVEDFYYDPEWCRRILRDKVMIRGFHAPNEADYFFSLLYHGHVQKPKFPNNYVPILMPLARKIGFDFVTERMLTDTDEAAKLIGDFLKGNGFYVTQPNLRHYNAEFVARIDNAPILYQSGSKLSILVAQVTNIAKAIFADAIAVRDSGDAEGAVFLLIRAWKLNPDSGEIRDELVRLVGILKNPQADLVAQVTNVARAIFADAIALRDSGDAEGAVLLLVRAWKLNPDSREIRDELARLVGILEQQRADLVAQPEAEPGDLIQRVTNVAKAIFAGAIAVPDSDDLIQRVANIAKAIFADAIALRDSGDIEGALALLVRSRELNPDSGEVRDELARLQR